MTVQCPNCAFSIVPRTDEVLATPIAGMTRVQKGILDAIAIFMRGMKYSPTGDQIALMVGLSSRGCVLQHIRALQARGYVNRARNQRGGLILVNPEEVFRGLPD